jgi:hypothetical protein
VPLIDDKMTPVDFGQLLTLQSDGTKTSNIQNLQYYKAMEQRREEVTRRPLYGKNPLIVSPYRKLAIDRLYHTVYDLPKDILTTLTRKEETDEGPDQEAIAAPDTERASVSVSNTDNAAAVGSKACSLCGVTFHTVEDQRSHIRSDLHGYNLKQRIRGGKAVSEGDFEKLVEGSNRSHLAMRKQHADFARS